MTLHSLQVINFRTYTKKSFTFSPITIIVGPNTIGKTNILEAIQMLSTGKSFRAEKDIDTIMLGKEFAKIEAVIQDDSSKDILSLLLTKNERGFQKKYLINNVGRRHQDFTTKIVTVLFSPSDLEIITDSPSHRRSYLDSILLQADTEYRASHIMYEKSLRQRNRLLSHVAEGKRMYSAQEFEYWNDLLLTHGTVITKKRRNYIDFVNAATKTIFPVALFYDHSEVTSQRLEKYHEAEKAAGVTLIGPQRDDISIQFTDERSIREFASRGEQRLSILQLKLLEIEYLKKTTQKNPMLLLDDIYSELDSNNIAHVTKLLPDQQTIITTTHLDFIPEEVLQKASIIHLEGS